jgi:hypothetical protein
LLADYSTEDGLDGEACAVALQGMFGVDVGDIDDEAALVAVLRRLTEASAQQTATRSASVSISMLGRWFDIDVQHEMRVCDLKEVIAATQGIPRYEQELAVQGAMFELKDSDKVTPGSHLTLRLRTSLELTGQDAVSFLEKCPEPITTVTRLALDFHGAQLPDGALLRILAGWAHLESLDIDLSNKMVGIKGCAGLSIALRRMSKLRFLSLRMQGAGVTTDGCLALADGLRGLSSLTQLVCELPANSMTTAGCAALAEGISRIQQLRVLSLHLGGNELSPSACTPLAAGLRSLTALDDLSLHLGGNTISHAGCAALAVVLAQMQVKQLRLQLGGCNLGVAGCIALANGLAKSPTVTGLELGLARNSIQDSALCALGDALESMVALRTVVVDLNANAMKDTGCAAIGAALRSLPDLEGAALFCIGSPAAARVSAHLEGVPSL